MSYLDAVLQPAVVPLRQAIADLRPQLTLVPGSRRTVGEIGFGVVLLAVAFAGLMTYLTLQTQLSQGAFDERRLTAELRDSAAQVQELQQQATVLAAPATLDRRARQLGMVPLSAPVFLRLSDGQVLGKPRVAKPDASSGAAVATLSAKQVGLTGRRAAQLQASQLPVDDSAKLVSGATQP